MIHYVCGHEIESTFPTLVKEAHAQLEGGLLQRVSAQHRDYGWEECCMHISTPMDHLEKIITLIIMYVLYSYYR